MTESERIAIYNKNIQPSLLEKIGEGAKKVGIGVAEAANSALLDLPEAAGTNLGILDKKAIEKYREENPEATAVAKTAGTIGSGFIPVVGAVGKGIQAGRAIAGAGGAAKAGGTILKSLLTPKGIAEAMKAEGAMSSTIPRAAAVGIGNAMSQQAIRGIANGDTNLGDIVTQGAWGAAGGAGGKIIGNLLTSRKVFSPVAAKIADDLSKDEVYGAAAKTLMQYGPVAPHIQQMADIARGGTENISQKTLQAKQWMINAARTADDYKIQPNSPKSADAALNAAKKKMDELYKIADQSYGNPGTLKAEVKNPNSKLYKDMLDIIDTQKSRATGDTSAELNTKLSDFAQDTAQKYGEIKNIQDVKRIISEEIKSTYKIPPHSDYGDLLNDGKIEILNRIKASLNNDLEQAATQVGRTDLLKASMEYSIIKSIQQQMFGKFSNDLKQSFGSLTNINSAITELLRNGNPFKALAGVGGQLGGKQIMAGVDRMSQQMAVNKFRGMIKNGQAEAIPMGKVGTNEAEKIIPQQEGSGINLGGPVAQVAADMKGGVNNDKTGEYEEYSPEKALPVDKNGRTVLDNNFERKAMEQFKRSGSWIGFSGGKEGNELLNDPYFKKYMQAIKEAGSYKDPQTGELRLNPEKIAPILFYDDRAGYDTYLASYRPYETTMINADKLWRSAQEQLGLPSGMRQNAALLPINQAIGSVMTEKFSPASNESRNMLVQSLERLASAGGNTVNTKNIEDTIMQRLQLSKSPQEFRQSLLDAIGGEKSVALQNLAKAGIINLGGRSNAR